MGTGRLFAYNSGHTVISGAEIKGDLSIQTGNITNYGSLKWYMGPNEDVREYFIAGPYQSGSRPRFWAPAENTEASVLDLLKRNFGVTLASGSLAQYWLDENDYWYNLDFQEIQTIFIFTGSTTWTAPDYFTSAKVLVVAGGGAGGGGGTLAGGGGGGAGGVVYNSSASIISGTTFNITIGQGGATSNDSRGGNGQNSVLSSDYLTITAIGGGGGGGDGAISEQNNGANGGSGGGLRRYPSANATPGSGTTNQGYRGGWSYSGGSQQYSPGGGGGAGGVGFNGGLDFDFPAAYSTGYTYSRGGIGVYYGDVFGTSVGDNGYFGGGGGAPWIRRTGPTEYYDVSGGLGGGGSAFSSGTKNTGGGGGGGYVNNGTTLYGGSGVVIIKLNI
jgi:hypothetical protein